MEGARALNRESSKTPLPEQTGEGKGKWREEGGEKKREGGGKVKPVKIKIPVIKEAKARGKREGRYLLSTRSKGKKKWNVKVIFKQYYPKKT